LIGDAVKYIDMTTSDYIFSWAPESLSPRIGMLSREAHIEIEASLHNAPAADVREAISVLKDDSAVIMG